jgi:hypothetical protein
MHRPVLSRMVLSRIHGRKASLFEPPLKFQIIIDDLFAT